MLNIHEMERQYCIKSQNVWINKYCFLCEYACNDCNKCPLAWPSKAKKYMCEDNGEGRPGLWLECYEMLESENSDWRKQAALARQIANLPEREDA